MSERTLVSLGCSPDADYAFLLPLTALLWRRIGFEPLAIIVGRGPDGDGVKCGGALEWARDPIAKHAFDALRELRVPTYSMAAVDGYPYATTAQCSRQHAAALTTISSAGFFGTFMGAGIYEARTEISERDWLMPADSDLWPISKKFYSRHENSPYRCVSYYWNGDNFLSKGEFMRAFSEKRRSQTLPTCHIAMRVGDWREVYGLEAGENLEPAIARTLESWYIDFPLDSFNVWMSDQDIMTARVCRQPWFPDGRPPEDGGAHASGEVLFVGRRGHPPADRMDRSIAAHWEGDFDPSKWTDAHVMRQPWTPDNWPKLEKIIAALLPEHLIWARQYQRLFTRR